VELDVDCGHDRQDRLGLEVRAHLTPLNGVVFCAVQALTPCKMARQSHIGSATNAAKYGGYGGLLFFVLSASCDECGGFVKPSASDVSTAQMCLSITSFEKPSSLGQFLSFLRGVRMRLSSLAWVGVSYAWPKQYP
jgi:hypothetical protein